MKPGDEHILQQRFVPPDLVDLHAFVAQAVANLRFRQRGLANQHVEAIAEPLHVEDVRIGGRSSPTAPARRFRVASHALPIERRRGCRESHSASQSVEWRRHASAPRDGSVPPRPDTVWPPESSGRWPPNAPAHPRIHAVKPGRRQSSARRAAAPAVPEPARRRARASVSCRRSTGQPVDR